ncbi:MAG: tetratricopeptide repeat protein [Gammaproteobacteria bacterium]|nr:tetratricopeptide repeat protein [Gammaproteobacteria bacterium]
MKLKRICLPLLASLFLLHPLAGLAADEAVLVEVPYPDVEELDPRVRRIVEPAIDYFKRMQPVLSDVELGRAYGRMGLVFQAFRMQEAAGASHRNAMALDPTNPRWHYFVAIYSEETGNLEGALALYRTVLAMAPDYPNTLLRIGRVSLEAGKLADASEAFEALLEKQPDLAAPALAGLGTIALQEKRLEEGVDLLERALVLQPQATQLHYRLAQAYRQLGDTDKAREHLEKRGDRIAWAPDPWVEEMKARARHPSYYVQQGIEAVKQGEMERAAMHLDLALALDPENVEALTRMAVLIGLNARREDAEYLISQALRLDPDHGLANSLQGALLAERRQFKEAQAFYFRAVNAEPENFEFRVQFANGLMRLNDFEAAAQQYAEALRLEPENASTRYGHAVALTLGGNCAAALQTIERGVQANPRVALTLNARARLYATCPDANESQRRLALEDAQLLYDQRPNGNHAETVAMAMAANGRFDEAMDYQGQAIFEAIKNGDTAAQQGMRENMQRYEARSLASAAWPELVSQ